MVLPLDRRIFGNDLNPSDSDAQIILRVVILPVLRAGIVHALPRSWSHTLVNRRQNLRCRGTDTRSTNCKYTWLDEPLSISELGTVWTRVELSLAASNTITIDALGCGGRYQADRRTKS